MSSPSLEPGQSGQPADQDNLIKSGVDSQQETSPKAFRNKDATNITTISAAESVVDINSDKIGLGSLPDDLDDKGNAVLNPKQIVQSLITMKSAPAVTPERKAFGHKEDASNITTTSAAESVVDINSDKIGLGSLPDDLDGKGNAVLNPMQIVQSLITMKSAPAVTPERKALGHKEDATNITTISAAESVVDINSDKIGLGSLPDDLDGKGNAVLNPKQIVQSLITMKSAPAVTPERKAFGHKEDATNITTTSAAESVVDINSDKIGLGSLPDDLDGKGNAVVNPKQIVQLPITMKSAPAVTPERKAFGHKEDATNITTTSAAESVVDINSDKIGLSSLPDDLDGKGNAVLNPKQIVQSLITMKSAPAVTSERKAFGHKEDATDITTTAAAESVVDINSDKIGLGSLPDDLDGKGNAVVNPKQIVQLPITMKSAPAVTRERKRFKRYIYFLKSIWRINKLDPSKLDPSQIKRRRRYSNFIRMYESTKENKMTKQIGICVPATGTGGGSNNSVDRKRRRVRREDIVLAPTKKEKRMGLFLKKNAKTSVVGVAPTGEKTQEHLHLDPGKILPQSNEIIKPIGFTASAEVKLYLRNLETPPDVVLYPRNLETPPDQSNMTYISTPYKAGNTKMKQYKNSLKILQNINEIDPSPFNLKQLFLNNRHVGSAKRYAEANINYLSVLADSVQASKNTLVDDNRQLDDMFMGPSTSKAAGLLSKRNPFVHVATTCPTSANDNEFVLKGQSFFDSAPISNINRITTQWGMMSTCVSPAYNYEIEETYFNSKHILTVSDTADNSQVATIQKNMMAECESNSKESKAMDNEGKIINAGLNLFHLSNSSCSQRLFENNSYNKGVPKAIKGTPRDQIEDGFTGPDLPNLFSGKGQSCKEDKSGSNGVLININETQSLKEDPLQQEVIPMCPKVSDIVVKNDETQSQDDSTQKSNDTGLENHFSLNNLPESTISPNSSQSINIRLRAPTTPEMIQFKLYRHRQRTLCKMNERNETFSPSEIKYGHKIIGLAQMYERMNKDKAKFFVSLPITELLEKFESSQNKRNFKNKIEPNAFLTCHEALDKTQNNDDEEPGTSPIETSPISKQMHQLAIISEPTVTPILALTTSPKLSPLVDSITMFDGSKRPNSLPVHIEKSVPQPKIAKHLHMPSSTAKSPEDHKDETPSPTTQTAPSN